MSANVLMISEQSFKDFTVASANIDLKNVTQVIKMTQDRYIHPIQITLGAYLIAGI